MLKNEIKYYNKCVTAPKLETERGVIAYYICKWLDGNEQSVVSLGVVPPDEQETQKSCPSLGFRFCVDYGHLYPFAYSQYSIFDGWIQVSFWKFTMYQ